MASPPFRRIGETEHFKGSLVTVTSIHLEGPGGETFEREMVHHPGAVVVVPLTAGEDVVMVRQYRAAVGMELLEVPAGKRDVGGEPTEVTAERELAEEVGLRAGKLELMAHFYNSPGFTDELTWLYLARDLEPVPHDRQGAEEQAMTVEEVPLATVGEMISSGGIIDAKSIIGLLLTRARVMSSVVRPEGAGQTIPQTMRWTGGPAL